MFSAIETIWFEVKLMKNEMPSIPLSVLDLSPIIEGGNPAQALRNTLDLARHVESLGYHRFWVAEHHNIPGVASAATAVVLASVAGVTRTIRVGSGGIMLPNHAPLVIAEQFGTLEALHPGRVDLGLGRAPGGDFATAQALRRGLGSSGDTFPTDLQELQEYFHPCQGGRKVRAIPGEGANVPIWLLGSSDFSASLAAARGLPFAFASHFAPDYLFEALGRYRSQFVPSRTLAHPYAMVAVNVVAADTDSEARRLFTSLLQTFLNLVRGKPGPMPPPVESMEDRWTSAERAGVERMTRCSVVGSPTTVRRGLQSLIEATGADELIVSSPIFDHGDRLRSYELTREAFDEVQAENQVAVQAAG